MAPTVILSLTTVPSRNGTLGPTIASLLAQTYKPNDIRLHVPPGAFTVEGVTNLWVPDSGPITKISAVLDAGLPGDAIIITADDDVVYGPRWLETLVAGAEANRHSAVGMSGWNASGFLRGGGGHADNYQFSASRRLCDVLEGWAGVAYRKEFFDDDILYPPEPFFWVDDVWISSYLKKRGVDRRVLCPPMGRSTGRLPGLHNREDFVALNRRAAILGFS